ncbi:hypothetical protein FRB95_014240 [Tulasnella sp. JGI-2019a]|nr:hypothetical protein FRB95_014240 [Tulasnella sp. JGI-2019a]
MALSGTLVTLLGPTSPHIDLIFEASNIVQDLLDVSNMGLAIDDELSADGVDYEDMDTQANMTIEHVEVNSMDWDGLQEQLHIQLIYHLQKVLLGLIKVEQPLQQDDPVHTPELLELQTILLWLPETLAAQLREPQLNMPLVRSLP